MKATGIIRRIDDLGRVVIPKEIRQRFKIREGDPLEIYTTNEGIMLAPYDNHIEKEQFATEWLRQQKNNLENHRAKFSVEGRNTTCEVITSDRSRRTGMTTCNPHDDFSPAIGMVVSFCRAVGYPIPPELQ